jgi:GntR family transcriptional repressor for pyruvate dehydrogenase complex
MIILMAAAVDIGTAGPAGVARSTLTGRVEYLLRSRILSGEWPPGTKLPAIERLAVEVGVSRTVAREAVKALATQGLLQVVHGHGTVVAPSTNRPVIEALRFGMRQHADLAGIVEVRLALEVEAASLAAERRTDQDVAHLRRALDGMYAAPDAVAFMEADVDFHQAVIRATHNAAFTMVAESIAAWLRETRRAVVEAAGVAPESPAASAAPSSVAQREAREPDAHAAVFRRIVARDQPGAAAAMRSHLSEVRDALAAIAVRKELSPWRDG